MQDIKLTDLVDVNILQNLQDIFAKSNNIATGISDENGVQITKHALSTDFCAKLTKGTQKGLKRCEECDRRGTQLALKAGKSVMYTCHAGLTDFAAPIMLNDKLIGCFVGGQILTQPLKKEKIYEVADELGIDRDVYWEEAQKIPVMGGESFNSVLEFIYMIAETLSGIVDNEYRMLQVKEEVEQVAKMKSDFLANMSHEIRTPMNAVIGMADMALREDLSPAAREYISQIKSSGHTLLAIINDILDFSKIESGKMDITLAEYDPMTMISEVSNIVETRIGEKEVELIVDVSPDLPGVLMGDSVRLKQIIINIANNAVKFTRQGNVTLKVRSKQIDANNYELQVSVKDTGIGIKKQDLAKIFESFQQVDSKRNRNIEGTGLGLAISKQLVELMGGTLSVESEYEVGSTFSFVVPQLQLNHKESIHINDKSEIVAAGLVSNRYIREQLEKDIIRLGGTYRNLEKDMNAKKLVKEGIKFLFISSEEFDKSMEGFVSNIPDITVVLIVGFQEKTEYDIPNLIAVKKPLHVQKLEKIFNREELYIVSEETNGPVFDYIAPEAEILLVDDNAINLTVAEGLLKPIQAKIETAISGKDAIDMLSEKHYDLIFMDHMMPGMDGVETTHVIRRFYQDYNNVPIIALTANVLEETKAMFLVEGMNDFIAKPIEIETLLEKVKQWLPDDKIQEVDASQVQFGMNNNESKIEIEGLDTNMALGLVGSEELFWEVLYDYYKVIHKKAKMIKELEEFEVWRTYTIEVHALKSASKQVGAIALSEKAAALEKAGNEENAAQIHRDTDEMLKEYLSYEKILAPYFADKDTTSEGNKELTGEELDKLFKMFAQALEELDIEMMEEVMVKMKEYRFEDWQSEYFNKLQDAVDDIDVDACEEIITEWKEKLK